MATFFRKKAPEIHAFFTKNFAILKIGPKSKFALQNFFPTIYATTWPQLGIEFSNSVKKADFVLKFSFKWAQHVFLARDPPDRLKIGEALA